jgi:hypothetical protein
VVVTHPVVEHFSEEFFLSPTEGLLCHRVHERHPSLGILQKELVGGVVSYGFGKVELITQRLLGLLALGTLFGLTYCTSHSRSRPLQPLLQHLDRDAALEGLDRLIFPDCAGDKHERHLGTRLLRDL